MQQSALHIIASIPRTEDFSALLLELTAEGAYGLVVAAMRRHSLVPSIQLARTLARPVTARQLVLALSALLGGAVCAAGGEKHR